MSGKRFLDTNVLILATAAHHGCGEVLSEDLNDGQSYNGVLVSNPFRR